MKTLTTVVDRAGAVARPPPVWAAAAALLAAGGGSSGRQAALRGGTCYAVAAVIANVVLKPMFDRGRPEKGRLRGKRPLTSSFPSGHAASDAAFCFGAAQELPWLILPLGGMAMLAHWSIVRTGQHHLTDVVAAGFIGAASAWTVQRLWPAAPLDPNRWKQLILV